MAITRRQFENHIGALEAIANAVTPLSAAPANDENGGYVASLTEAVMGVSTSLNRIASAIESLAEAVRESKGEPE